MSISKYLAFDFGAESGRAVVGILDGGKISIEEIHRFPNRQTKILGHLHWDVLALFEEIKTGLRIAVQKGHRDIESIGIDTWGVDFGLVDKNNAILSFPYCYRDSRTDGIMEQVFGIIPKDEIYSITGIQFMQLNSIYQLYSARLSNEDLLGCCDKILFMPDLFNFMLTGIKKSEYTIASTSQLLNVKTKSFDDRIFSALGIRQDIMAPIVMPGTVIGRLLPEIGSAVGLGDVDVVAVGCHDTASAIAAVPAQQANWAYLSSGTWSLIGIETPEPVITGQSLKNNFTNEGGVFGTIRLLSNVMGLWLLQQTRKSWEEHRENFSYDQLARLALDAEEFRSIVDPDDVSFLNPPDMPEAIAHFCRRTGQPVPASKGEFVRCILESLALKYKSVIGSINEMTGRTIKRLHIVGGGSQNEILNQFTADACGIPVIAGPVEATAIGNILVQAIARGKIKSLREGRKIVSDSFQVKFYEPKNPDRWNAVFRKTRFNDN